jgi:hypothetical protein
MREENTCGIPWFLIAKQAVRGTSLETLSIRHHVSVDEIRRHLDKAIICGANGQLLVRTNKEINEASQRARNDLVSVLLEAIDELSVSTQPRLSQLKEFSELLNSAARLFQWPTVSAMRVVQSQHTVHGYAHRHHNDIESEETPTGAVNLALIATTPEQLAELAKNSGKFSDDLGSKTQEKG